ncbi:glucose-6-phosphate dehydrogenase assembly protein OpcA [Actinomyces polynesiensis]|uniref:glucose-6-phosphate dehydrogenase assembly protein OpcA n=1 Tax=Actinomyces polynesiensis TaxID=1325934 RepID=UPI0005BB2A68|nr:glucose-6-phosphate dehydrogenase assembly protein OpcA [Actinomyces polynesiensis]
MIITLKDTTASEVASRIIEMRDERGSAALGRVLTLIVVVDDVIDVDRAIEISDAASREHPCRVIVVVDPGEKDGEARLNAQIRVGGEAGPSDVVVLEPRGDAANGLDTLVMPLLLSDTPVVTYWPNVPPDNPGEHPLGVLAVRRITDSRSTQCPMRTLMDLARTYSPGDTDLAWSGVTLWRALLATVVEGFDRAPELITVTGHATHPSAFLVAAWLQRRTGVRTVHEADPSARTITGVHFSFADGAEVSLTRRAVSQVAHLSRSGLDTTYVNLPRRSVQDCLMEELRRLDPDVFYSEVLTEDLPRLPEVVALLEEGPEDA